MTRFFCLYFLVFILTSCKHSKQVEEYPSVTFCNEEWMVSNLDVAFFRNGDPIPAAKTDEEWRQAILSKQAAWCYYNNDSLLGKKHGKLYNWYALVDPRGLAPEGWKIADDQEWTNLTNCFGGQKDVLNSIAKYLEDSTSFKLNDFLNYGGTRGGHGTFTQLNEYGRYYTLTELIEDDDHVWRRALSIYDQHLLSFGVNKEDGLSVKCVKIK